jgi:hypothetical protein
MVMEKKSKVTGIDFRGNNVVGVVECIVGFGDIAIVRINEDRTGLTECYVSDLKEMS